jgi:hypothetical protein
MSQIKPTQIIQGRKLRINPNMGLPVDLDPQQNNVVEGLQNIYQPEIDPATGEVVDQSSISSESQLQQEDPTPSTPVIISVKEQIVKFMPDGTAKVDVILEVQDIAGAVEYDIRVAKNAGNL